MRRLTVLVVLGALVLSGCATGRSLEELRATPVGAMSVPLGSALAWESHSGASFNLDGPICPELSRTYASNDPEEFHRVVAGIIASGHPRFAKISPRPEFEETSFASPRGSELWASGLGGTSVTVRYRDLDDGSHVPDWIDTRAWRFLVFVSIYDDPDHLGGHCR